MAMSFSPEVWRLTRVLAVCFLCPAAVLAQEPASLESARALAKARKWSEAIAEFDRVESQFKQSPEFFYERGLAFAEAKKNVHAMEDFTEAIRLRADYRDAWYMRGHIYARQGNHQQAIQQFAEVIRLDPSYADGFHYRGISYFETKQMPQAIADFDAAAKLRPKLAEAYYYKGRAIRRSGNLSTALVELEKAVALEPKNAEWLYEKAQVLMWMGDSEKAIADLTECMRLNPTKQHYYNDRASIYSGQGRNKLAIADLSEAIRLKPELPFFRQNRAKNYLCTEEFDKALTDATDAIRLKGNAVDTYTLRARVYNKLKQQESALADMLVALKSAQAHSQLESCAWTYLNIDEPQLAFETNTKALALDPNCREGQILMGNILCSLKRYEEAVALLEKYRRDTWDAGNIRQVLGYSYFQLGNFRKARDAYSEALAAQPIGAHYADRLLANFRLREFKALRTDLDAYVKKDGWETPRLPYLVLMCYVAEREMHQEAAAKTLVAEAVGKANQGQWSTGLLRFYTGQWSAEELLKSCTDQDQETDAHTYIALFLSSGGDREGALQHLRWVEEKGLKGTSEYNISMAELQRLQPH